MRQLKITSSITSRESLSLQKYLLEIDRVALLTPDEEVELTGKIRQGDKAALDKLTKANLRFVVSVAKQIQTNPLYRKALSLIANSFLPIFVLMQIRM